MKKLENTLNSQYYNHDSLSIASAFNGYTSVFTAKAIVTPCNVYHIKLAIADGTDDSYDSGVFFEAGSFDATEPGALNVIHLNKMFNYCVCTCKLYFFHN